MRYVPVVLLLLAAPLSGQTIDDKLDIAEQAIARVRSDVLPPGELTLSPASSAFPGQSIAGGDETVVNLLAGRIQARAVMTLEEAVSCPGLPSSCRMANGGVAAVAVSDPVFEGDRATVTIDMRYRSDSVRTPIVGRTVRVRLEKTKDGWSVFEVEHLRVT